MQIGILIIFYLKIRAKNIKCKVTENKKLVEVHIAEYKNIISDLRSEID
jgi:kinesin family protein 18/19